jgi:hypothetical protein
MVDEQKAYDAQHTAAPPPTAAPATSSDTAEIVLASPACLGPGGTVDHRPDQAFPSAPDPALTAAFEIAKTLVPLPLPALLPLPCCPGGAVLTIDLSNGELADYGPCVRPPALDAIVDRLYRAFSSTTGP